MRKPALYFAGIFVRVIKQQMGKHSSDILLTKLPIGFNDNCVLFNVDVAEGSRLYENIFVSGGALLADDVILKTVEIGK